MSRATLLQRIRTGRTLLLWSALVIAPALAPAAKDEKPEKPEKPGKAGKIEKKAEKAAAASRPPSPAAVAAAQFEPFRIIVDRNIFNPNRTGRARVTEEAPPPKIESFALVGTMQSDKGLVAIFEGSAEPLRAAVPVGGEIGGFTVSKILPNAVELTAGEKKQTVRMSQQLRRPEGGEWRISARDMARVEAVRPESEVDKGRQAATPAIPVDASDVVRRLMEQRQKQLKQ